MNPTYDKTERKIIESTLKTLSKEGLNSTTTAKIAENAELSEVTLFRKFKSKDNLLKITKDYYLSYVLEEIDLVFKYDSNKDFDALFKEIWWDILNFFENNLDIFQVAIEGTLSTKFIEVVSDKILKNLTKMFKNAIDNNQIREINPSVAALNIYSVIFQSILLWRIYGGKPIPDLNKRLDDFLDIFFNGVNN